MAQEGGASDACPQKHRAGRGDRQPKLCQQVSTSQLKGALHHRPMEDSAWTQVSGNTDSETGRATGSQAPPKALQSLPKASASGE